MPREQVTKSITDDYGDVHQYLLIQHPAEEGINLLPVVLRVLGQAGGPLLDVLVKAGALKDGEFDVLEADIDGVQAGHALTQLADEFVRAGGADFCKQLLKYTVRDDKDVAACFTSAYQGNYGELAQAVWFALDANFGPSLRARLGKGSIGARVASLSKRSA